MNGLLLSHTVNLRGKNYILIHVRNLFPSIASGELWSNKYFQEPLNIYIGDHNNGCEGDKRTPYGRMSKFVFLTFFNSVKPINRHPFTPFLLCGRLGEIDLLSWLLITTWIAFGLLMVLEDGKWNSSTQCADHVKPW